MNELRPSTASAGEIERLSRGFSGLQDGEGLYLVIDAPTVNAEAAFGLEKQALFWSPSADRCTVGLGCAAQFKGQGPGRFEEIQQNAQRYLGNIRSLQLEDAAVQAPRAFGGFAFGEGGQDASWEDFGDARFILPRWRYELRGKQASLSLLISADERRQDSQIQHWLGETLRLRDRLGRIEEPPCVEAPPISVTARAQRDWDEQVLAIVRALRSGELQKVVAARRCVSEFSGPVDLVGTLKALQEQAHSATRFAFRFGRSSFLGATPERLIRRQGTSIRTEALAGTFNRATSEFATELLRSPKEHAEHIPVLGYILDALRPLCGELKHPEQPEIKELPQMLHLRTPVEGRLHSPVHILELVRRLHPTPAVGGVPANEALDWILKHEPDCRGWYAGPVGWFDANGDGEFLVALRSGLIEDRKATLFAGGGIVEGSEPQAEYQETELKLRSLRLALRIRAETGI